MKVPTGLNGDLGCDQALAQVSGEIGGVACDG